MEDKNIPAQNERYLHHIPVNAASKADLNFALKKLARKMSSTCSIFG